MLVAQRSLYTAEDALAQSSRNIATDLIALYKALGGGWETLQADGQAMAAATGDGTEVTKQ